MIVPVIATTICTFATTVEVDKYYIYGLVFFFFFFFFSL